MTWNRRAAVNRQIAKLAARRDALTAELLRLKATVPTQLQNQLPM
jgi:hypothetical protein